MRFYISFVLHKGIPEEFWLYSVRISDEWFCKTQIRKTPDRLEIAFLFLRVQTALNFHVAEDMGNPPVMDLRKIQYIAKLVAYRYQFLLKMVVFRAILRSERSPDHGG